MNEFQWELIFQQVEMLQNKQDILKAISNVYLQYANPFSEDCEQLTHLIALALHKLELNDLPDYMAGSYLHAKYLQCPY